MTPIDPQRMYSIAEAAAIADCSGECIRLKIKNKKLVAARIDTGPWQVAGYSLAKMMAPITAIQQATVPTTTEVNRLIRNLLKPAKVVRQPLSLPSQQA